MTAVVADHTPDLRSAGTTAPEGPAMNRTTHGPAPVEQSLGDRAAHALVAYRAGETEPMAALVREATPLLWNIVRSQGVERDEAEDVVQGVWLALVRHTDSVRDPQALLKWLVVTARRSAWQTTRRRRESDRRSVPLADDVDRMPGLTSREPSPEEPVLLAERDQVLWRCFQALPERCRTILRSVAMADRPDYRRIAEEVGMRVTSVGATRGRCLARLRTLLDQDEGWDG